MDLLDHPSLVHLPEHVGVQESVEDYVEMRGELPMVILEPPRVEDHDTAYGTHLPQILLDSLTEAAVAFQSLYGPFGILLIRRDNPMAPFQGPDRASP